MGYPMAGHLALAGHEVTVYNRTAAKAVAWCEEFAATPAPPVRLRREKQPQAPISFFAASATTMTCAPSRWAAMAPLQA